MKNDTAFMRILESYIGTYLPAMKGAGNNTILSYKSAFRLLIEFLYEKKGICADRISFADLDYDTLEDFFNWIESDRKCSASTKNQRLSALLSFSKYAQNRDFDAACTFRSALLKIPMKKTQHRKRSVFSIDEVGIILSLPGNETSIGKRDTVLLSVMYASGARSQEICDLVVRNIHFNGHGAVLDINGKGGKSRKVPIHLPCRKMLKEYISYRRIAGQPDRHIFSSQTHEYMSVAGIEALFKKYIRKAKEQYPSYFREDNYSPHTMRHSCASHMLESGVPIAVIKNFLGHASIQTTEIYAEISQDTVNKKLIAWNQNWHAAPENCLSFSNTEEKQMPSFLK